VAGGREGFLRWIFWSVAAERAGQLHHWWTQINTDKRSDKGERRERRKDLTPSAQRSERRGRRERQRQRHHRWTQMNTDKGAQMKAMRVASDGKGRRGRPRLDRLVAGHWVPAKAAPSRFTPKWAGHATFCGDGRSRCGVLLIVLRRCNGK